MLMLKEDSFFYLEIVKVFFKGIIYNFLRSWDFKMLESLALLYGYLKIFFNHM